MKRSRIIRIIVLILGAAFLGVGIYTGDFVGVFRKATKICYECIGIG